jgi:spore maturation protein CgeB
MLEVARATATSASWSRARSTRTRSAGRATSSGSSTSHRIGTGAFYGAQRFTLNLTRDDMKRAGYAPSVRLFEAAACGVPIISDTWPGLETFFRPGEEILVSDGPTRHAATSSS